MRFKQKKLCFLPGHYNANPTCNDAATFRLKKKTHKVSLHSCNHNKQHEEDNGNNYALMESSYFAANLDDTGAAMSTPVESSLSELSSFTGQVVVSVDSLSNGIATGNSDD
jgi:lipopolysaccharide biosynthesis glycosyltransferase